VTPVRITEVRCRVLRAPLAEPIRMSFAAMTRRTAVLVEVLTDNGLHGVGESWANYPPWAADERVATVRDGVAPLLVGEPVDDVPRLHAKLVDALVPLGRQWGAPGPIAQAISGADMALWDLYGTRLARSMAALAGGRVRDRVGVYASGLGPSQVERDAERCRSFGFRLVKLRVGFGTDVDVANLRAARAALGDEAAVAVDANQRWSLPEAVAMAGPLRDAGVAWVEEPITGNALADLEEFHRQTGLRVATGENLYLRDAFRPYAESPGVHVLQPDVSKCGGITEFLAISEIAAMAGKPVLPHLYGGAVAYAATLQLAACCPAVETVEYDVQPNPLRDPLLRDPPCPVDGVVTIPDGAGLGVEMIRK
jgi:L-alanine-DL-glutamate epimerase-like enolase superfamily enzyme